MNELQGTLLLVSDGFSTYASLNGEILNGEKLMVLADGLNVTWSIFGKGCGSYSRPTEQDLFDFAKRNGYEIKRTAKEAPGESVQTPTLDRTNLGTVSDS